MSEVCPYFIFPFLFFLIIGLTLSSFKGVSGISKPFDHTEEEELLLSSTTKLFSNTKNIESLINHYDKISMNSFCDESSVYDLEKLSIEAINDVVRKDEYLISSEYSIIPGALVEFNFLPFGNPAGSYAVAEFPFFTGAHPPGFCNSINIYNELACTTGFHLGPKDIVVIPFCTPPEMDYFSLSTYVTVRYGTDPRVVPSDKMRFQFPRFAAAEVSDAMNHLLLNSTGNNVILDLDNNDNKSKKDFFGKRSLFITTADQTGANSVIDSFVKMGFPKQAININPIPKDKVRFRHTENPNWVNDKADGLGILLRMSNFNSSLNVRKYKAIQWPIYLLKSKKFENFVPLDPLPVRKREIVQPTESILYKRSMIALEDKIMKKVISKNKILQNNIVKPKLVANYTMIEIIPDPDQCLKDPRYKPFYPVNTCGWLITDALYSVSQNVSINSLKDKTITTMEDNRIFIILGTNTVKIGKSLSNDFLMTSLLLPELSFKTADITNHEMEGSAEYWFEDNVLMKNSNIKDLFVHVFARDCKEFKPYCTEISKARILNGEPVYFVERHYLHPETKIGPNPEEIINSRVLVFDI